MKDRARFFYPVQVRYVETDLQGHVFFGNYFIYFDVALIEYLKAVGYSYHDFIEAGVDFFYVATDCQYQGRAFFDDTLHIHTRVGKVGNTSFTFEFAIIEEVSDRPICTGHIVAVTVDKETGEKVPVPEKFRKAVSDFESRGE